MHLDKRTSYKFIAISVLTVIGYLYLGEWRHLWSQDYIPNAWNQQLARHQDDPNKMLEDILYLTQHRPNISGLNRVLCDQYMRVGDYGSAVSCFQQERLKDPNGDAINSLLDAKLYAGQLITPDDYIHLKQYLGLHPDDEHGWWLILKYHFNRKHWQEVLDYSKVLAHLLPEDHPLLTEVMKMELDAKNALQLSSRLI